MSEKQYKAEAFALAHPDEARSHPASWGLGSGPLSALERLADWTATHATYGSWVRDVARLLAEHGVEWHKDGAGRLWALEASTVPRNGAYVLEERWVELEPTRTAVLAFLGY